MTRLLVPELEARRHLIEGYAQFPDVPEDVTNLWKAPFGPPEEWDLCVAEHTIDGPHGPVPVRVYMPTGPAPDGGRACLVWMHGGAFAWGDLDMAEAHEVARGIAGRADVVVVSVDYRLCPVPAELGGTVDGRVDEQGRPVRFPVPQDDCAAVPCAGTCATACPTRDVEELLAERGVQVDHVTLFVGCNASRHCWPTPLRFARHAPGDRWLVDETYVKVNGRPAMLRDPVTQQRPADGPAPPLVEKRQRVPAREAELSSIDHDRRGLRRLHGDASASVRYAVGNS
jgi:hypothetical protein